MPTISMIGSVATVLRVFSTEPRHQQRALDLLTRATQAALKNQPGYISISLLKGLNGRHIAFYSQWQRREDFQAMLANEKVRSQLEQVALLLQDELPVLSEADLYNVAYAHHAGGGEATIAMGGGIFQFIDMFSVEPKHQSELMDVFKEKARALTSAPGYISTNVHRSLDGRRVVHYGQYRSRRHFAAILRQADLAALFLQLPLQWLAQNKCGLPTLPELHEYEVVFVDEVNALRRAVA